MKFEQHICQNGERDLFMKKGGKKLYVGWMYKKDEGWIVGTNFTSTKAKDKESAVRIFNRISSCYK